MKYLKKFESSEDKFNNDDIQTFLSKISLNKNGFEFQFSSFDGLAYLLNKNEDIEIYCTPFFREENEIPIEYLSDDSNYIPPDISNYKHNIPCDEPYDSKSFLKFKRVYINLLNKFIEDKSEDIKYIIQNIKMSFDIDNLKVIEYEYHLPTLRYEFFDSDPDDDIVILITKTDKSYMLLIEDNKFLNYINCDIKLKEELYSILQKGVI